MTIIITIMTQIERFFKNCFNLEFDCKKAGSTKINTPSMYIKGINLSIIFANQSCD